MNIDEGGARVAEGRGRDEEPSRNKGLLQKCGAWQKGVSPDAGDEAAGGMVGPKSGMYSAASGGIGKKCLEHGGAAMGFLQEGDRRWDKLVLNKISSAKARPRVGSTKGGRIPRCHAEGTSTEHRAKPKWRSHPGRWRS